MRDKDLQKVAHGGGKRFAAGGGGDRLSVVGFYFRVGFGFFSGEIALL